MPEQKYANAIVLGSKKLGEKSFVVSLFTKESGRYLGVYKGKSSPQPADIVNARWQARLSEQLGTFYLENLKSTSGFYMDDWPRLCCIRCICELLNKTLPERQIYSNLYDEVFILINNLNNEDYVKHYILFELNLLQELGFGLDFSDCAGGGDKNNLAFVSPKTGRSVSYEKGLPYRDKLLSLPKFLWQKSGESPNIIDLKNALNLTGYFLQKNVLNASLPDGRNYLLKNK
ncbi:MAG: DNA repair protein RecO [Alphaproteobacteria bacterium]|nr:DNA repair protein RecO [Alphaproteobacteria bacterium]